MLDRLRGFLARLQPQLRQIRARHAAQGLVEYAMITATVALVGVAGLNALSLAQRQYFEGVESTLDPPPPPAPGQLLHPTLTAQPECKNGAQR